MKVWFKMKTEYNFLNIQYVCVSAWLKWRKKEMKMQRGNAYSDACKCICKYFFFKTNEQDTPSLEREQ